jgi:hypothetical protein
MKAWCINLDKRPERWTEFVHNDIPFPVDRFSGIESQDGSLGCIMSHLEVMKLFDHGMNVIFEDDFQLIQPWSVVEQAIGQLPADWHALYISAILHTPLVRHSDNLFRLQMGWGNHGIIYNGRTIAEFVLQHTPQQINGSWRNIDSWMAHNVQPDFNCYVISPLAAIQRASYSDILRTVRKYEMSKNFNQNAK